MTARHPALLILIAVFFGAFPPSTLLSAETPPPPHATPPSDAGIDWNQVQAEEDRIDKLAPAEQGPAYLDLRKRLITGNAPAAHLILQRLSLKIALAAMPANPPKDDYGARLALSKQAALIGETYVKQNDPARALAWEHRCRAFAFDSLWADDLRNKIHAWHEARLRKQIETLDWLAARNELSAWNAEMGADHAVAEGVELYARARAGDLIASIEKDGPRDVLVRLQAEETENPDCAAWNDVRDKVAESLQSHFQRGVATRNIGEAKTALETQTAVSAEFNFDDHMAPLNLNGSQLEMLVRDLQPSPIQREYGHVHAVNFRIEVMQTFGQSSFHNGNLTFNTFTMFPVATGDWRIYSDDSNPWWYGFNMTGLQSTVIHQFDSASRFESEGYFLFGHRTEKTSGSLGVGLIYNSLSFTDSSVPQIFHRFAIAAALRVDWEAIVAEKVTLYGTANAGVGTGVSVWEMKAGIRYYFNHNFSIGGHLFLSEVNMTANSTSLGIHASNRSIGPSMMMQF